MPLIGWLMTSRMELMMENAPIYSVLAAPPNVFSVRLTTVCATLLENLNIKPVTPSFRIGGIEYAVQRIGLNFVVYDSENSRVVDSVEFNTYMGLDHKRIDVQDLIDESQYDSEQIDAD